MKKKGISAILEFDKWGNGVIQIVKSNNEY